jgi:hypothetical protein
MSCPQTKLAALPAVACCLAVFAGNPVAAQVRECASGQARVVATVADHSTGAPLAGAGISARWRADTDQRLDATTDSAGRALLCFPLHQTVTLRSAYRDHTTAESTTLALTSPSTFYAAMIDVPGSLVRGRVLDMQTGAPIPRVHVRMRNSSFSALSDTTGRFVFERVPIGDYRLHFEHIGYAVNDAPLQVRHEDLDATVRMTPAAIALQPIVVTAFSRRLEHVGFYDRSKRGVGTFFDRKQIDAMNIQDASDLLRRIPQLKLVPQLRRGSNQQRNATVGRRGNCRYIFLIDGSRTLPDFEMDYIAGGALEGVEVYAGLAEVPAGFKAHATSVAGSTVCGVIAIWTRDSR